MTLCKNQWKYDIAFNMLVWHGKISEKYDIVFNMLLWHYGEISENRTTCLYDMGKSVKIRHSFQHACMTWGNQWKIWHSFQHACMTLWGNQWKQDIVFYMHVWHYGKINESNYWNLIGLKTAHAWSLNGPCLCLGF